MNIFPGLRPPKGWLHPTAGRMSQGLQEQALPRQSQDPILHEHFDGNDLASNSAHILASLGTFVPLFWHPLKLS